MVRIASREVPVTKRNVGLLFVCLGCIGVMYSFMGGQAYRLVREGDEYKVGSQVHHLPPDFVVDGYIRYSRKSTLDSLVEFFTAFDRMAQAEGIDYWCTSGTLLGIVRHNGIIPWDDDVDLAVTRESGEKLLALYATGALQSKYNFVLDPSVVVVMKLRFADRGWFPSADIYVSEVTDGAWRYCLPLYAENNTCSFISADWWPKEYVFDEDLFPLQRHVFEDTEVNVPYNLDKVVRQFWGERALHEAPPSQLYSIHSAYAIMQPLIKLYYWANWEMTPPSVADPEEVIRSHRTQAQKRTTVLLSDFAPDDDGAHEGGAKRRRQHLEELRHRREGQQQK